MQNINNLCMGCMGDNNGEQVCSVCGFDSKNYHFNNALELRTQLANRYVVGKVVSTNGEGFTYIGFDTVSESIVNIHEYFPTGLCNRNVNGTADIISEPFEYNDGVIKFVDLYKKLGSLNELSSIYKVIDIFETNKTAYCITDYLPGITLNEFLLRNGGVLTWEQARPLFVPLISAVRILHENGIIHGAISPETLIIGRDGRVRLNNFCINKIRTSGNEMVPEMYSGYAAVEQYDGKEITTATDVYGFAATIFKTVTGNAPGEAIQRRERDNLSFPKSIAEKLPRGILVAMANALQIEPEDRTADMNLFREDIKSVDEDEEPKGKSAAKGKNKKKKSNSKKYTLIASFATAIVLLVIVGIAYIFSTRNNKQVESSSITATSTVSVGDIGNSSVPESKYSVPDFSGSSVSSLLDNEEYSKWFDFTVVKKEYNNKIEKGKVCAQSVAVGTAVSKDTKVELTVSLGSSNVTIPKKLKGMSKQEAYICLLELGFDPDSIQFIEKKGSVVSEEQVIETSPDIGTTVSRDSTVIVYYNTNVVVSSVESFTTNENGEE